MRWLTIVALCALGCDDGAGGSGSGAADARVDGAALPHPDMGGGAGGAIAPDDAGGSTDDATPAPDAGPPEPDAAPAPEVAWIEVALAPRRALYAMDVHPVARAVAYDRRGGEVEVAFEWRVAPRGIAEIDADRALTFTGEGPGVVLACVAELCGRAAFYVDAGPPVLQVTEPARGATLGGDGSQTVRVRGTATDTGGDVVVRVNGVRVALGDGGAFSLDLPARFGVNRVVTTADDGVRRPPVMDARDVLWAPAYEAVDAAGATIPRALTVRLDQAVLDGDGALEIPDEAAELHVADLAAAVEAFLLLASVDDALGDPQIAEGDGFALRIEGIDLGAPSVDLMWTGEGIELFLRMPSVAISVSGQLTLEGEAIDLTGELRAGLAAYASLEVGRDDAGAFSVELVDTGVAVESLGGAFADETAQVLVGTLGSRLRAVARDLALELVSGVITEELPGLVEDALGSLVTALDDVPIRFEVGIEGAPPVDLRLRMTPAEVERRRQSFLAIHLDARVVQPGDVVAPHADPGVPLLSVLGGIAVPGDGFGAEARLALINVLLHEVWRAGVLQLSPPLPDEVAGLFGEVLIDARLPPVVAPAEAGGEFPLEVQLGDLRMITQPPGAPNPDVYALTLRAGMSVGTRGGQVELVVADAPNLQAVLVSKGSAAPISAEALAALVGNIVWPLVLDAVDGGLGFGLDPQAVDAGQLAEFAPRVAGMVIAPTFNQPPRVEEGRLLLEGGLDVTLEVGAAE